MKTAAWVIGALSFLGCIASPALRPLCTVSLGLAFTLGAVVVWRAGVFELRKGGQATVWTGRSARAWAVLLAGCSLALWNGAAMAWAVDEASTSWLGFEIALCSAIAALWFALQWLGVLSQRFRGPQRFIALVVIGWGMGVMELASIAGVALGCYMLVTGHKPY